MKLFNFMGMEFRGLTTKNMFGLVIFLDDHLVNTKKAYYLLVLKPYHTKKGKLQKGGRLKFCRTICIKYSYS